MKFRSIFGFGLSGLFGGFAFPAIAFAADIPGAPMVPGFESFGANGAIIGVLLYLVVQGQRERVAEAFKFAERLKEMQTQHTQTVANYQATTADLILRVLAHYERQIPESEE